MSANGSRVQRCGRKPSRLLERSARGAGETGARRPPRYLGGGLLTRDPSLSLPLSHARKELENIESAIRQAIITPATRAMLTETEERITRLEAVIQAPAGSGVQLVSHAQPRRPRLGSFRAGYY